MKEDAKKIVGGTSAQWITPLEIERIMSHSEDEPFEVLGPHRLKSEKAIVIRCFLPRASEAWIEPLCDNLPKKEMIRVHAEGLFQVVYEQTSEVFPYQVGFRDLAGYVSVNRDPYAFRTEISDFDLYLIGQGQHYQSYEKFGARVRTFQGVSGVHFAVWAPNAESISVIGNFNHWRVGAHPMSRIHFSGVWGLFIPGLKPGEVYKYAVKSKYDGAIRMKSDPYGLQAELRPHTASVVASLDAYVWKDSFWMKQRSQRNFLREPISIYEVHLGSWKRQGPDGNGFLSYVELAHQIVEHVKQSGYTHVELLPVMEHPLDESWGYQVVNYFAPTSRFGKPEEFMYFVDYCHQHGIGVILDWVPAHFPKDSHGLADFDGKEIYAYENWKKGEQKEWGTLVFDFGRNEVRNFLISNALFWLDKYHMDGLRVDAVASILYLDYSRKDGEWEPNSHGGRENLEAVDFLKKFNEVIHDRFPGVLTIAEESTSWAGVSRPTYLGGLGFSMKWNMGWMHDTLEYFSKDPIYRKFHQGMLTFSLLYAFSENFVLPISHDEVVYGKRSLLEKMPGDDWQKFANVRLFLGYLFAHPGKKLLFMTHDIGQRAEWNVKQSLDWHLMNFAPHQGLQKFLKDLQVCYRKHRALYERDFDPQGFEWIDFSDSESSVFSFVRWSADWKQAVLAVYNMTPVPRLGYRVGVPKAGFYQEILNSDALEYQGSGIGNLGGLHADRQTTHGRSHSLSMNLPPLAVCLFKWEESNQ